MSFAPDELIGQFILCKSERSLPEGWLVRRNGPWLLATHASLPVEEIIGRDERPLGWLLGHAISAAGRFVAGPMLLEVDRSAADVATTFEAASYAYGGRFVAILLSERTSRVYLDACGSLAAVYCPSQQIVASTPTLIPQSAGCEDHSEAVSVLDGTTEDAFLPFGLTSRRGVERLLPGHYVDLERWQAVRHWPAGDINPIRDVPAAVDKLAAVIGRGISAVAEKCPLYMSLTAGRDSRVLLACARRHVKNVVFLTQTLPNASGRLDCQVAPAIARRFGLNHMVLPFERLSEGEIKDWVCRTGGCVRGLIANWAQTYKRLDPARAVLLGAGAEVGRGFHWRPGDTEASVIRAEDVLQHMAHLGVFPATPEVKRRAQAWLDGIPTRNALTIWDLLHNEVFDGCWYSPVLYGFVRNALHLLPFSHRELLEVMLGLPTEYRRSNQLPVDLVRSQWPELLEFPFNWPIGVRRYLFFIQRRAGRLGRKIFGAAKRGRPPGRTA